MVRVSPSYSVDLASERRAAEEAPTDLDLEVRGGGHWSALTPGPSPGAGAMAAMAAMGGIRSRPGVERVANLTGAPTSPFGDYDSFSSSFSVKTMVRNCEIDLFSNSGISSKL